MSQAWPLCQLVASSTGLGAGGALFGGLDEADVADQVAGDDVAGAQGDGFGENVLQLADVARPAILLQAGEYVHGDLVDVEAELFIDAAQEGLHQVQQIFLALPQWWQLDGHDAQSVI